ncbi:MAG: cytochrome c oxidase subunit II [Chloroflexi bacterium]|nr:cytochrome c oxidase subunit II [Chloroflexota bacterium]
MRHFVVVGILVIAMAVLTYIGLDSAGLMPVQASAQSVPIDRMWNEQVIAMSFLFALIVVPMVYSLVVFRRKKGDTTDAQHIEGNTNLEITWTILPLFAVVAFAYLGGNSLAQTLRADPEATVIKVTGRQWSWSFEYPEYGVTSPELRVPVGKQLHLQMTSTDVIHSFWVPEFRVKQDLVPGRVTEMRITPTMEGSWKVRCAEICGASHYAMETPVIVMSQAEFDAWMAEQVALAAEAAATPEGRGQALVNASGCTACHAINGVGGNVGPTWNGVFGHEVELADGSVVLADEAYLAESIKAPQAKIVAGYETQLMPAYGFTDEQIADIVAFIKTLR